MNNEKQTYKEKHTLLTKQYAHDIGELVRALTDLHNSNCGAPKLCGHDFWCICPSDRAEKLIKLFSSQ